MNETGRTPPQRGHLKIIAVLLWAAGGLSLAFGAWRTLAAAEPVQDSVFLFAGAAIAFGFGTAIYGASARSAKPKT